MEDTDDVVLVQDNFMVDNAAIIDKLLELRKHEEFIRNVVKTFGPRMDKQRLLKLHRLIDLLSDQLTPRQYFTKFSPDSLTVVEGVIIKLKNKFGWVLGTGDVIEITDNGEEARANPKKSPRKKRKKPSNDAPVAIVDLDGDDVDDSEAQSSIVITTISDSEDDDDMIEQMTSMDTEANSPKPSNSGGLSIGEIPLLLPHIKPVQRHSNPSPPAALQRSNSSDFERLVNCSPPPPLNKSTGNVLNLDLTELLPAVLKDSSAVGSSRKQLPNSSIPYDMPIANSSTERISNPPPPETDGAPTAIAARKTLEVASTSSSRYQQPSSPSSASSLAPAQADNARIQIVENVPEPPPVITAEEIMAALVSVSLSPPSGGGTVEALPSASEARAAEALQPPDGVTAAKALPFAGAARTAEALPTPSGGGTVEALPSASEARAAEALQPPDGVTAAKALPFAGAARAAEALPTPSGPPADRMQGNPISVVQRRYNQETRDPRLLKRLQHTNNNNNNNSNNISNANLNMNVPRTMTEDPWLQSTWRNTTINYNYNANPSNNIQMPSNNHQYSWNRNHNSSAYRCPPAQIFPYRGYNRGPNRNMVPPMVRAMTHPPSSAALIRPAYVRGEPPTAVPHVMGPPAANHVGGPDANDLPSKTIQLGRNGRPGVNEGQRQLEEVEKQRKQDEAAKQHKQEEVVKQPQLEEAEKQPQQTNIVSTTVPSYRDITAFASRKINFKIPKKGDAKSKQVNGVEEATSSSSSVNDDKGQKSAERSSESDKQLDSHKHQSDKCKSDKNHSSDKNKCKHTEKMEKHSPKESVKSDKHKSKEAGKSNKHKSKDSDKSYKHKSKVTDKTDKHKCKDSHKDKHKSKNSDKAGKRSKRKESNNKVDKHNVKGKNNGNEESAKKPQNSTVKTNEKPTVDVSLEISEAITSPTPDTDNLENEPPMTLLPDKQMQLQSTDKQVPETVEVDEQRSCGFLKSPMSENDEQQQLPADKVEANIALETIKEDTSMEIRKVPKIRVVLQPNSTAMVVIPGDMFDNTDNTTITPSAQSSVARIKRRRMTMVDGPSQPMLNSIDVISGSSFDYEYLIDHKRQREKPVGAEEDDTRASSSSRRSRNLAVMFEKTDDNCSISTHNILEGKRRSRFNHDLNFNETSLSRKAFADAVNAVNAAAGTAVKPNETDAVAATTSNPLPATLAVSLVPAEDKRKRGRPSKSPAASQKRPRMGSSSRSSSTDRGNNPPKTDQTKAPPLPVKQRGKRLNELDKLNQDIANMYYSDDVLRASGRRNCLNKLQQLQETQSNCSTMSSDTNSLSYISDNFSQMDMNVYYRSNLARRARPMRREGINRAAFKAKQMWKQERVKKCWVRVARCNLESLLEELNQTAKAEEEKKRKELEKQQMEHEKQQKEMEKQQKEHEKQQKEMEKQQKEQEKLQREQEKLQMEQKKQQKEHEKQQKEMQKQQKEQEKLQKERERQHHKKASATPKKNTNPEWHSNSNALKKCVLCGQTLTDNDASCHYVQQHGEHYAARLPPDALQHLRAGIKNRPVYRIISSKVMQYMHKCLFCSKEMELSVTGWMNHYSQHMGEFRYSCSHCRMPGVRPKELTQHLLACAPNATSIEGSVPPKAAKCPFLIHVCHLCDFVQSCRPNLEQHFQQQHGLHPQQLEGLGQQLVLYRIDGVPQAENRVAAKELLRRHHVLLKTPLIEDAPQEEKKGKGKSPKSKNKKQTKKQTTATKPPKEEYESLSEVSTELSVQCRNALGAMPPPLPEEEQLLVINECKLELSEEQSNQQIPIDQLELLETDPQEQTETILVSQNAELDGVDLADPLQLHVEEHSESGEHEMQQLLVEEEDLECEDGVDREPLVVDEISETIMMPDQQRTDSQAEADAEVDPAVALQDEWVDETVVTPAEESEEQSKPQLFRSFNKFYKKLKTNTKRSSISKSICSSNSSDAADLNTLQAASSPVHDTESTSLPIPPKTLSACNLLSVQNVAYSVRATPVLKPAYHCLVKDCTFLFSNELVGLQNHFTKEHPKVQWNGDCVGCCRHQNDSSQVFSIQQELKHMVETHMSEAQAEPIEPEPEMMPVTLPALLESVPPVSLPKLRVRRFSGDRLTSTEGAEANLTMDSSVTLKDLLEAAPRPPSEKEAPLGLSINQVRSLAGRSSPIITAETIPLPAASNADFVLTQTLTQIYDGQRPTEVNITIAPRVEKQQLPQKVPQQLSLPLPQQFIQQLTQQFPPQIPQQFPPQLPQQLPPQLLQQYPQQFPQQLPQSLELPQQTQVRLQPDRFRCMAPKCGYCAHTIMCIREHMKFHSYSFGERSYLKCAYCSFVGADLDDYVQHGVVIHHLASRAELEDKSQRSDISISMVIEHMLKSTGLTDDKLFMCPYDRCTACLPDDNFGSHLLYHMGQNPSNGGLKCKHCRLPFDRPGLLSNHLQNWHARHRYFCSTCLETTPTKELMQQHTRTCHADLVDIRFVDLCEYLDKVRGPDRSELWTSTYWVTAPTETFGPMQLELFLNALVKELHIRRSGHKLSYRPSEVGLLPCNTSTGNLPMTCAQCHFKTRSWIELQTHLWQHRYEMVRLAYPNEQQPLLSTSLATGSNSSTPSSSVLTAIPSRIVINNKSRRPVPKPGKQIVISQHIYGYVAAEFRYKCAVVGCPAHLATEKQLHCHLTKQHSHLNRVKCLHCSYVESTLNVRNLLFHLECHQRYIYQCGGCNISSAKCFVIDRHIHERHRGVDCDVIIHKRDRQADKNMSVSNVRWLKPVPVSNKNDHSWYCYLCRMLLSTHVQILKHLRLVHGIQHQFACPHCASTSDGDPIKIISHIRQEHKDQLSCSPIQCFNQIKNLHKWVLGFICNSCNGVTTTHMRMINHCTGIHMKSHQFMCFHCNIGHSQDHIVIMHMKNEHRSLLGTTLCQFESIPHEIPNLILWEMAYELVVNCISNRDTGIGILPAVAADSSSTPRETIVLSDDDDAENVVRRTFTFACSHCPETNNDVSALRSNHWAKTHSDKPFSFCVQQSLSCPKCQAVGTARSLLEEHLPKRHKIRTLIASDALKKSECAFCDYKYRDPTDLGNHILVEGHLPNDVKNLTDEEFKVLIQLGMDTTEHKTEYYQCSICRIIMPTHNGLVHHAKVEHRGVPEQQCCRQITTIIFNCSFCMFASASEMTTLRHMLDHYPKFCSCSICPQLIRNGFDDYIQHFYSSHRKELPRFQELHPFPDLKKFLSHVLYQMPNGLIISQSSLRRTTYANDDSTQRIYDEILSKAEKPPIPRATIIRKSQGQSGAITINRPLMKITARRKTHHDFDSFGSSDSPQVQLNQIYLNTKPSLLPQKQQQQVHLQLPLQQQQHPQHHQVVQQSIDKAQCQGGAIAPVKITSRRKTVHSLKELIAGSSNTTRVQLNEINYNANPPLLSEEQQQQPQPQQLQQFVQQPQQQLQTAVNWHSYFAALRSQAKDDGNNLPSAALSTAAVKASQPVAITGVPGISQAIRFHMPKRRNTYVEPGQLMPAGSSASICAIEKAGK